MPQGHFFEKNHGPKAAHLGVPMPCARTGRRNACCNPAINMAVPIEKNLCAARASHNDILPKDITAPRQAIFCIFRAVYGTRSGSPRFLRSQGGNSPGAFSIPKPHDMNGISARQTRITCVEFRRGAAPEGGQSKRAHFLII